MMKLNSKNDKRQRRHRRVRAKVKGTAERPRLSIFKSNKAVYAQLIDDEKGVTLASATSLKMKENSLLLKAKSVGNLIATVAKSKGIKSVVFDRGGYVYTGNVKAIADSAREGGLKF